METKILFATFFLTLSFLSCDKEPIVLPENPPSPININENELTQSFGTETEEKIISISSNYGWQYRRKNSSSASWLHIKDYPADNKLSIRVAENKNYKSRADEIVIFNNTDKKTISVTQSGTTNYVPESSDNFSGPAQIEILDAQWEQGEGGCQDMYLLSNSKDGNPLSYMLWEQQRDPESNNYISVRYTISTVGTPKYLSVQPVQEIKGRSFSKIKLYYSSGTLKDQLFLDSTIVTGNTPFIVTLPDDTRSITELKLEAYPSEYEGKQIVALAEIALYEEARTVAYEPFSDASCRTLKEGTTSESIDRIPFNIFTANMAHYVFLEQYPVNRMKTVNATPQESYPLNPGSYDEIPNPTGLYYDDDYLIVFVGSTGGNNIAMRIVNIEGQIDYSLPLHEGVNFLPLYSGQGGYGFIRYEKGSVGTYPEIFLNLASGSETE